MVRPYLRDLDSVYPGNNQKVILKNTHKKKIQSYDFISTLWRFLLCRIFIQRVLKREIKFYFTLFLLSIFCLVNKLQRFTLFFLHFTLVTFRPVLCYKTFLRNLFPFCEFYCSVVRVPLGNQFLRTEVVWLKRVELKWKLQYLTGSYLQKVG